jgi:hypothetical protein
MDAPVKGKRGRKSKKELMAALNLVEKSNENINITIVEEEPEPEHDSETDVAKPVKKRGRKPKGGKIVEPILINNLEKESKPNVILYLKCFLKDLSNSSMDLENTFDNFITKTNLNYELLENHTASMNLKEENVSEEPSTNIVSCCSFINNNNLEVVLSNDFEIEVDQKEIWKKLKTLEHNLHVNNINDKKSACFWCTYDFDNPPVYIPKSYIKDSYHVYGCFCSPECATAHLMNESIDSSTKFERYHYLNHIYAKVFDYKKNIKPAPNPYYMLDKYYGNLSIQEYRSLLRNERLFLIVDKPLTKIMPELHEDNDDFMLNNKIMPSNNSSYNIKRKIQKKTQNKTNIVNEKFGLAQ